MKEKKRITTLAEAGHIGGKKSKRKLTAEQAKEMVKAREAKRLKKSMEGSE